MIRTKVTPTMRRPFVYTALAMAAVPLVGAACSSPSNTEPGAAATTSLPNGLSASATTASSSLPSHSTSSAPSALPASAASVGSSGGHPVASTVAGAGRPSTSGTAAAPASASNAPLAPATPGTYQQSQQGSTTFGSTTLTPPPNAPLVVGPPDSNGIEIWKDYTDGNQPPQETSVQYRRTGPFILSTTVMTPQGNATCTFNPAIPAPTWPPAVGDSFQTSGNCGNFTVSISGRITGSRTVQLDGQSFQAWVVDASLSTKGQVDATGTQEDWYSPALRLPLYQNSTIQGTYGLFSFHSQLTTRLESIKPG